MKLREINVDAQNHSWVEGEKYAIVGEDSGYIYCVYTAESPFTSPKDTFKKVVSALYPNLRLKLMVVVE